MADDPRCRAFWLTDICDQAEAIIAEAERLWGDEHLNFCRSLASEITRRCDVLEPSTETNKENPHDAQTQR